jgi:hypothetical protein
MVINCIVGVIWFYFALYKIVLTPYQQIAISSLVGFGPVILAWILTNISDSGFRIKPVNMSFIGNFFHLSLGNLFCSAPITYICWLALQ